MSAGHRNTRESMAVSCGKEGGRSSKAVPAARPRSVCSAASDWLRCLCPASGRDRLPLVCGNMSTNYQCLCSKIDFGGGGGGQSIRKKIQKLLMFPGLGPSDSAISVCQEPGVPWWGKRRWELLRGCSLEFLRAVSDLVLQSYCKDFWSVKIQVLIRKWCSVL